MLANLNRPQRFDEVVGQENIIKSIKEQSKKGKYFSTYVFSGQFGSGKTTVARILAKAVNCTNKTVDGEPCGECEWCRNFQSLPDYYEVDGASNNGVDKVRELIDNVSYMPITGKYKVYIIDEVHMLSTGAFNALLKTLEEPPAHAMFILATTEVRKIPATVLSRAAVYNFQQLSVEDMSKRLLASNIALTEDAAQLIAKQAGGAMRNAWGILEQAASGSGESEVTSDNVRELLMLNSSENVFGILKGIKACSIKDIASEMEKIIKSGNSLVSLFADMEDVLKDAVLYNAGVEVKESEVYLSLLREFIDGIDISGLCYLSDGIMSVKKELKSGGTDESAIIKCISLAEKYRMTDSVLMVRICALENKVRELEENICNGSRDTYEAAKPVESKETVSETIGKPVVEEIGTRVMIQETSLQQTEETAMDVSSESQLDFGLDDFDFFFGTDPEQSSKEEKKSLETTDEQVQQNQNIKISAINNEMKKEVLMQESSDAVTGANTAVREFTKTERDIEQAEMAFAEAMKKDPILNECMHSCADKVIVNNEIIIRTPYKAIKKIIDKCIEVYMLETRVELI